jgi:UDP-glucose 4-epimerase
MGFFLINKNMKILVTGGTGYIGSHTIIDLIDNGYDVVSIDNGFNSDKSSLDAIKKITGKQIKHYTMDLCDFVELDEIFTKEKFDGVIHFAALKAVGESMEIPFTYFINNLNSTINTAELAVKHGVKAFIFSSSCTVYGDVTTSPVTEETPWQEAASVYGRTKQMGEQILKDISALYDMRIILLRYFNPAGAHPSGSLGESPKNVAQNLVPVITETAIGKRESMKVFGTDYDTRDGSCVRDYIHVMDLAHAHTLALSHVLANKQLQKIGIYNLGIGEGVTVLEAINAFEKNTGVKLNYEIAPRRHGDVAAIFSNYAKAKTQLGWSPKYDISDIMQTAWLWEKNRSASKI